MSAQHVRLEIRRSFPNLPASRVVFLGAGVDSEAYLVDEEWVFRFPKREAVSRALGRELALLPKLAPRLPVATPHFSHVGRRSDSGLLFAGYRLIPGRPLTPELFTSLAPGDQEQVLATLAAFLRAVHSFPIAEAAACSVGELSTRSWVESCWSRGSASVLSLLDPRDGLALARLIERFLADQLNFAYTPALLYADFAPEHILYDPVARAITGIIDWGDLAIGDPDYDLVYLHQDYGPDFVRRLLAHHPHPEPERLFAKLRVFDACDHIHAIASFGDEDVERHDVEESVAALVGLLRASPG